MKKTKEDSIKRMSKMLKPFLSLVIIAILVFTLSPAHSSAAKKVKLSKTKITLNVGKTKTLKLKNNKKKVKWSSSKKKVATVSKKGKVTAKKKGTATITAKAGKKKYKCKVTVKAAPKKNNTPANNTPTNNTPANNPPTDNPPVVTGPSQYIKDNYAKLKSYILNYGSENSSGEYFIKMNGSYNDVYGIVYRSQYASFEFIYLNTRDSADDGMTMTIRESDLINGSFEYIISLSVGLDAVLTASGNINTLNDSSVLNWMVQTSYSVPDDIKVELINVANTSYQISYFGWNMLLSEYVGLTMTDLGFQN